MFFNKKKAVYLVTGLLTLVLLYVFIGSLNSNDCADLLNLFQDQGMYYEFSPKETSQLKKLIGNDHKKLIKLGKLDQSSECLETYLGCDYYKIEGLSDAYRLVEKDDQLEVFVFTGVTAEGDYKSFKAIRSIYSLDASLDSIQVYAIKDKGGKGKLLKKIEDQKVMDVFLHQLEEADLIEEGINPYGDFQNERDHRVLVELQFSNKNTLSFTYYKNLKYIYLMASTYVLEPGETLEW